MAAAPPSASTPEPFTPLAPPRADFAPIFVGPSRLTLHGVPDGVVAVAEETVEPGEPIEMPIGFVHGTDVDFARLHWLDAGSTDVTAVGGRLAGPLFLSKRFNTGPPLPATLTLGPTGWHPLPSRAGRQAVDHVFALGPSWVGTLLDPWGQESGFVTLAGPGVIFEGVKEKCAEPFRSPLRSTAVASAADGTLVVAGADCAERPRIAVWKSGQRTPSAGSVTAPFAKLLGGARLRNGVALLTDQGVFLGGPDQWVPLTPSMADVYDDLAVQGTNLFVVREHRVYRWEGSQFAALMVPLDVPVTSLAASDIDLYVASGPVLFRLGNASPPAPASDLRAAMFRLLELSPIKVETHGTPRAPPCESPLVLLGPVSPYLPADYDFPASRERLAKPAPGVNEKVFGPYEVEVVHTGRPATRWLAVRAPNAFTALTVARTGDFPELRIVCEAPEVERVVSTVPKAASPPL